MANLAGRAAVCARVTGAIALAVSDTADGRGRGIRALPAEPFVVSGITGALVCRRRVGTKHLRAPLCAIPVTARSGTEDGADSA